MSKKVSKRITVLLTVLLLTNVLSNSVNATEVSNDLSNTDLIDIQETAINDYQEIDPIEKDDNHDEHLQTKNLVLNKESPVTIYDGTFIVNKVNSAENNAVISIAGGRTYLLPTNMQVNTNVVQNITIKSDGAPVTLINDYDRHLVTVGNNDLTLNFKGVVFSTTKETLGGIEHKNSGSLVIDGLEVRDSLIKTKSFENDGFIKFVSDGNLTIKNMKANNNTIVESGQQGTAFINVKSNNSKVTFEKMHLTNFDLRPQKVSLISVNGENVDVELRESSIEYIKSYSGSTTLNAQLKGESTISIIDTIVMANETEQVDKGAVSLIINGANSKVNVIDSNFTGNTNLGGGSAVNLVLRAKTETTVSNTSFAENTSGTLKVDPEISGVSAGGGAIKVYDTSQGSQMTISESFFYRNEATNGGAIYVASANDNFKTVLNSTTILNNHAVNRGGGIYYRTGSIVDDQALLEINGSGLMSNTTTIGVPEGQYQVQGEGGAVYYSQLVDNPELLKVSDSSFYNNQSSKKIYWNYRETGTTDYDKSYFKNISTTSISDNQTDNNTIRNNIINGDDVYTGSNTFMIVEVNSENILDLEVDNYVDNRNVYSTINDNSFPHLVDPIADGYRFMGWKDHNDNMWDFDNDLLITPNQDGNFYLNAVWEKIIYYDVTFKDGLNEDLFDDAVYKVEEGLETPNHVPPVREHYNFVGWSPVISEFVTEDATYVAQWERIVHKITYNDGVENEEIFKDQQLDGYQGLETPKFSGTPVRIGYNFAGWSPNISEFVTESVTYKAIWDRIVHDVVYTDGVENEELFKDQVTQVYEGLETPIFEGTPVRAGYKFIGWTPVVSEFVTQSIVYTAQWERIVHKITYTDGVENEEVFKDQVSNIYEGLKTPDFVGIPTRYGYKFTGWSPEISEFVTETTTYTATWERTSYSVIYTDGVDNEVVFHDQVITVYEGLETPKYNGNPERFGYKFIGWSPDVADIVTESTTYTALWERVVHTVAYTDGVGSEQLFEDQTYSINEGDLTPQFMGTPNRVNYNFIGWTPEVSELVLDTVTYTAVWERITHQVTYTDGVDKEEVFKDQVHDAYEGLETPKYEGTPTRFGYKFIGWYPDVANVVTESSTYTALWERVVHNVIYTDGIDYEQLFEDQTYTVNEGDLTPEFIGTPVREGYNFVGWSPEVSEFVLDSVTYSAVWVKPSYTVVFTSGYDDVFEDQVFEIIDGLETPSFRGIPKRAGYKFIGWSPKLSEFVTEDITYTAVWDRVVHSVMYTDGVDSAQLFEDQTYTVNEGELTPEFIGTPLRDGYDFIGWSPEVSEYVTDSISYSAKWSKKTENIKLTPLTPAVKKDDSSPIKPNDSNKEDIPKTPISPETGVSNNQTIYIVVMLSGLVLLGLFVVNKRKNK